MESNNESIFLAQIYDIFKQNQQSLPDKILQNWNPSKGSIIQSRLHSEFQTPSQFVDQKLYVQIASASLQHAKNRRLPPDASLWVLLLHITTNTESTIKIDFVTSRFIEDTQISHTYENGNVFIA